MHDSGPQLLQTTPHNACNSVVVLGYLRSIVKTDATHCNSASNTMDSLATFLCHFEASLGLSQIGRTHGRLNNEQ